MPGLLLIALATLVSEDLTCIATGVLVAQGKLRFLPGVLACLLGIFFGDILLFLIGRVAGRAAFRWKAFQKFASPAKVETASRWLSERGMAVILLSRFTPGLRLTTYFAAGMLKTKFWSFASMFLIASAVWTPLLVGSTAVFGEQSLRTIFARRGDAFVISAALFVTAIIARKVIELVMSYGARRRLAGFLKRKIRWEFWPPWAAYFPVVPYLCYLALRHRSLTLFMAANPGMPSGGFVGESKSQILDHLSQANEAVAAYALIPSALHEYARIQKANEFLKLYGLTFPVVLKPDVGERGSGVAIVRRHEQLGAYLRAAEGDIIIQQYIEGMEFGVFYYRYPGEAQGHIFSITEKRFPEVIGDGASSLARLILQDDRAVCLADTYLSRVRRPLDEVLAAGERIQLVEIGSHCRGAVFLDRAHLKTPALEEAIDRISRSHPGFFIGRYDIRTPSLAAFRNGAFKVIELNGVSAEATHIYDPAISLFEAYRVMFRQWSLAFEIGALNRNLGERTMPALDLWKLVLGRLRKKKGTLPHMARRPIEEAS